MLVPQTNVGCKNIYAKSEEFFSVFTQDSNAIKKAPAKHHLSVNLKMMVKKPVMLKDAGTCKKSGYNPQNAGLHQNVFNTSLDLK